MASKGQGLVDQIIHDKLQEAGNFVIQQIALLPNANDDRGFFDLNNYKNNTKYILRCDFLTRRLYKNPTNGRYTNCRILVYFKKGQNEFYITDLILEDRDQGETLIHYNLESDIKFKKENLQVESRNTFLGKIFIDFLTNRKNDTLPRIDLWENSMDLWENGRILQRLEPDKPGEPGATAPRISCTSEGYSFTSIS